MLLARKKKKQFARAPERYFPFVWKSIKIREKTD